MKHWKQFILIMMLVVFCWGYGTSSEKDTEEQGKIDTFKEPYIEDKHQDNDSCTEHRHDKDSYDNEDYEDCDDDEDDGSDDDWNIISWLLNETIDNLLCSDRIRYAEYPYRDNDAQYLKGTDSLERTMAGTFSNYYIRVKDNLWGYNFGQEVKFPSGISLEANYTQYIENVHHQATDDRMGWFKGVFNCQMGADTSYIIKMGLGGAYLSGATGGVLFQGAIDVFPAKPWVLQGSIGYALLDGDKGLTDLEFKIGRFHRRTELYLGYRSLSNVNGARLNGPFAGWSWWF
jgi:hypothetical protein